MSMDVSSILGTIPADCTLFHIPFEATCHPPLRKWTNLTKPHQPGFGAILLQPHQADFGQPSKMRAQTFQKGGRKKKTWVLVCFPHFQVTSNLSPHREPQVVVKHLQKKRASGGLLSSNFYWIACIILKIPSNPGQISSGVGDPNDYSIYMLCKYHSLSEHTQPFHPRLFPFFRIFPTFPRPVQLQHPTKAMPRYFFRCGVEALLSPD